MLIYLPNGRLIQSFKAYEMGLGIKSVAWFPSSQFLAIGSYDQKVRLLNHYTWGSTIEISHPEKLCAEDIVSYVRVSTVNKQIVYKETDNAQMPGDSLLTKWEKAMSKRAIDCGFKTGGLIVIL